MFGKLDWSEIQSADYGYSNPSSFMLSLESVKLLLVLLNDRAVLKGAWKVGSEPPTSSEWDDIQEFVSGTIDLLFGNGKMICILEDQKTAGVDGGTFTAGAWRVRDINTKVFDEIGVTLSSNEFSLPAGKYLILATTPGFDVDRHKIRLYNTSDSAADIQGQNSHSHSPSNATVLARLEGVVDIATSKTFRIEHRCQTTKASTGLGISINTFFTVPYEVYTRVIIQRI